MIRFGASTQRSSHRDGLHDLLEDFYRIGGERVESAILALLLRDKHYRAAFLEHCGVPWEPGDVGVVRTEYRLQSSGVADLLVEWEHAGLRHLLIEHKPRAPFTKNQPANYVKHLRRHEAAHGAFVLLCSDPRMKERATRRILQHRALPDAPSGSSWSDLDRELRAAKRSRHMRFRTIPDLVRALASVDGAPMQRELAEFLRFRHCVDAVVVAERDKKRVKAVIDSLRLADGEPWAGVESYGTYLWYDGEGAHSERLWFGVEPPVAKQLDSAAGTFLVVRSGYLPPKEMTKLAAWERDHHLTSRPVQSGEWLAECAWVLPGDTAAAILEDLASRLGVERQRGKR